MPTQPSKTTLYVAVGCAVLVLILVAVVLVVYTNGGDPTVPGGLAVAAAAAAAEATRRRNTTRQEVAETKTAVKRTAQDILNEKEAADKARAAVPVEVAKMSDEQLKDEGNKLFGGKE